MTEPLPEFNPYHRWLSLPRETMKPNHYQLLSVPMFEPDADIIAMAAEMAERKLRRIPKTDPHAALLPRLLKQVASARDCLGRRPEKSGL